MGKLSTSLNSDLFLQTPKLPVERAKINWIIFLLFFSFCPCFIWPSNPVFCVVFVDVTVPAFGVVLFIIFLSNSLVSTLFHFFTFFFFSILCFFHSSALFYSNPILLWAPLENTFPVIPLELFSKHHLSKSSLNTKQHLSCGFLYRFFEKFWVCISSWRITDPVFWV